MYDIWYKNPLADRLTKTGKWMMFMLPFVTVLREGELSTLRDWTAFDNRVHYFLGLEGVIFVGSVSLGQPGSSIPIAVIVGILCGLLGGVAVYQVAGRTSMPFGETSWPYFHHWHLSSNDNFPRRNGQLTSPYWSGIIQQIHCRLWTPLLQPPPRCRLGRRWW